MDAANDITLPLSRTEEVFLASDILLSVARDAGVRVDDARAVLRALVRLSDYDLRLLLARTKQAREDVLGRETPKVAP